MHEFELCGCDMCMKCDLVWILSMTCCIRSDSELDRYKNVISKFGVFNEKPWSSEDGTLYND